MGKQTGELIKQARAAAGLTQEQLAKKVGLSTADLRKAEHGELELTQTVLRQIARATGVTQASLLNAEKTPAKKAPAKKTASGALKLTAAEKTLVQLYRQATPENRSDAIRVLKGEKTEVEQLVETMFGDKLKKMLKR